MRVQIAMLIDRYNRKINYLRISVTDRCDLRCTYCIPKGYTEFEKPSHWLNFNDIERIVRQFTKMGTHHFRLTGGEPLLRKNIVELVTRLKAIDGVKDLSLSTNATQLEQYAIDLKRAGLDRINISLDSLTRQKIFNITGFDAKDKILSGLMAAKDAGFKQIKINMVPIQGINHLDIDQMVEFCMQNQFILRLIELMPMGENAHQHQYINLQPIIQQLSQKYNLSPSSEEFGQGPAKYWSNADKSFYMGYITPMSQHFCGDCNRVRLTVDGTLYMCLGQEHQYSLAALLQAKVDDHTLEQAIRNAINLKPLQHDFLEQPLRHIRNMSKTGG